MPFKLIRFQRRRNKASETSNAIDFGLLGGRSNADDDRNQMGNLIQSLHGSRLGNINAPFFSNNTVYSCQPSDNQDYAEIKVRNIILKKELQSGETHHELQSDGTLQEVGRIRLYDGYIYKDSSQPMLVRKYEGLALKDWKRDLDVFSAVRHPNIVQLYGLCDSKHFTALIFHSGHQHTFRDYHLSLSGPSFVSYVGDLLDQYKSAVNALRIQSLQPQAFYMPLYNVDDAGQLVVHTFSPRPSSDDTMSLGLSSHQCNKDMQGLFSRINTNSFSSKSLLGEYYNLLAVICEMHGFSTLTNFNPLMMHQQGTTTLHVSGPYILRLDNRHLEKDHILCECMPDMSIRCTVPMSDRIGLVFHRHLAFGVQSSTSELTPIFPIFNLWASQVHHLNNQMKINDMEIQTTIPQEISIYCNAAPQMPGESAGAAHKLQYPQLYLWVHCTPSSNTWWWSTDSEGQTTIPITEIEDAFNINLDIKIHKFEYHIPQQIYPILWDIHKACGFNPDSTEMAEYLGYPLLEPVLETIPAPVRSGLYEEIFLESVNSLSAGEMATQENEEIGSDNESENGSTSSKDTFCSAASHV